MLGKLPAQSETRSGIPSKGICFSVPTVRRKSLTHTYRQENKHTALEAWQQKFMQRKESLRGRKKRIMTTYLKISNNLLEIRSYAYLKFHQQEFFPFFFLIHHSEDPKLKIIRAGWNLRSFLKFVMVISVLNSFIHLLIYLWRHQLRSTACTSQDHNFGI